MAESQASVRTPLFDRLVESDEDVSRTLDRQGLLGSVRRELERLFNTRSSLPARELAASERTVIDYGVPDFSHLSAKNPEDRAVLIGSVTQAIEAYEPRLRAVQVVIDEGGPEGTPPVTFDPHFRAAALRDAGGERSALRAGPAAENDPSREHYSLKIRIQAELKVDPVGVSLTFESLLPLRGGRAVVYGGG